MRRMIALTLTTLTLTALAVAALAAINPNFTPMHLMEASTEIFLVKVAPADPKGKCVLEVQKVLKGQAPDQPLTIDVVSGPLKELLEEVRNRIAANVGQPAMIFIGKDEDGKDSALLHVGGKWLILMPNANKPGSFDADTYSDRMEGTWAGGTDTLMQVTEQCIRCPNKPIPVVAGVNWESRAQIGKVGGRVSSAQAMDLASDGRLSLFVGSDAGDAVFAFDGKAGKPSEIAAKLKLASRSRAAAWGDFNGDGRLDLASWDDQALVIWSQCADRTFSASKPVAAAPKEMPVGLSATDAGAGAKAGLLWSSAHGAPVLLVPGADGAFAARNLDAGAIDLGKLGEAVGALIADFDGDGLADVIQPFASGSLFYKGRGAGRFEPAAELPIALGPGRANAFVGDWNMDGRFDVYGVSEAACSLWENRGGAKFVNTIDGGGANLTGEMAYISQPGGIAGNVCDFNNDGCQDVFLVYGDKRTLFFFNRGFRSFGHGHSIDLEEIDDAMKVAGANEGQQAGVCADLNGDGTQDEALVLRDGGVWVYLRDGQEYNARAEVMGQLRAGVRVALAPGGACAGPVTVTAEDGEGNSLGAWNVVPGTGDAWICRLGAGELTVSWRLPGGEAHKKEFTLEDKAVRFVLPAEGGK